VTFVVHSDRDDAVLGLATAWGDGRWDEASAKSWAMANLRQRKTSPVGEWHQVGHDHASWWTVDLNAGRWFLRRHEDVWLLLKAESNMPGLNGADLIEWAEDCIKARYEVDLERWQIGPGTSATDTEVFYIDTKGTIVPKDRSDAIRKFIAGMY
jgi:hypothetical protein